MFIPLSNKVKLNNLNLFFIIIINIHTGAVIFFFQDQKHCGPKKVENHCIRLIFFLYLNINLKMHT